MTYQKHQTFKPSYVKENGISIIIPIYNQKEFISRAICSVWEQDFTGWEIILINDGSTDGIGEIFDTYYKFESNIIYLENPSNMGLGYTLNKGIDLARYEYIAYLPADDVFFRDHLKSLWEAIERDDNNILAYSGLKYNYQDSIQTSRAEVTYGNVSGMSLQLVQVLHKKNSHRWVEREELVTDDLGRMYWDKLQGLGNFVSSEKVTAEWVSHPLQRHKLINELRSWGGIHRYKQHYNVSQLLRFHSSTGHLIDEFSDYNTLKYEAKNSDMVPLKILLVGELSYNAERICALEEVGHDLYGLWMKNPYYFNTTGPLPFGQVKDISFDNWQQGIDDIKPDVIYALLNSYAVPLAYEVLRNNPHIPFVWHFKEGPFICRQQGMWDKLIYLFQNSDGQIYINEENKKWFGQFLRSGKGISLILDGDLPSRFYFKDERSQLLSDTNDGIHTVVSGRPFGIEPEDLGEMAKQNIHLHLYGNISHKTYGNWINRSLDLAPDHLHLYHTCPPSHWTTEFSKYDAGWLHVFQSSNHGELLKMDWMDLNYPARMTTLAAAGLPMIQRNNDGHLVASQSIIKELDMGIFFKSFEDLAEKLRDKKNMTRIRENCWHKKMHFSFDQHVGELTSFLKEVIQNKKNSIHF